MATDSSFDKKSKPSSFKLLLPLTIILASCCLLALKLSFRSNQPAPMPELSRTNLVQLSGRWCLKGTTNPFTGILLELYPDGSLQSRSIVSNGLLNGLSEGWYTNRQLQVREFYLTNYSNGTRIKWYPDGRKLSEAQIVVGKMNGLFQRWYENGTLAEKIPMREGKIEGEGRNYYESGLLKSRVKIHDGQVIFSEAWPDGKKVESSP
jgi:antitoxin component YwqK of YwqJK toxin-antitoxin module